MCHLPSALIHSPTLIRGILPTTATISRKPRAFTFSTQKPVSSLWNVISSTSPSKASSLAVFMVSGTLISLFSSYFDHRASKRPVSALPAACNKAQFTPKNAPISPKIRLLNHFAPQ